MMKLRFCESSFPEYRGPFVTECKNPVTFLLSSSSHLTTESVMANLGASLTAATVIVIYRGNDVLFVPPPSSCNTKLNVSAPYESCSTSKIRCPTISVEDSVSISTLGHSRNPIWLPEDHTTWNVIFCDASLSWYMSDTMGGPLLIWLTKFV